MKYDPMHPHWLKRINSAPWPPWAATRRRVLMGEHQEIIPAALPRPAGTRPPHQLRLFPETPECAATAHAKRTRR